MSEGSRFDLRPLFSPESIALVGASNDLTRAHGISAFLVDKGTPGFSVGRHQQMMGMRGIHECELGFVDCEVPAENLLGEEGQGFILAMQRIGDPADALIQCHRGG